MPGTKGHTTVIDSDALTGTRNAALPSGLRLLCIGPAEPSWSSLALQLDGEGCAEPQFRWISSANEALAVLRDESFDCILICGGAAPLAQREAKRELEPFALLSAIRASGCDDAVVLIAEAVCDAKWVTLCELECEVLLTPSRWESIGLVPVLKRAMTRVHLLRENHRMTVGRHRRLVRERDEAEHLLSQQRQILSDLHRLAASQHSSARLDEHAEVPSELHEDGQQQRRNRLPRYMNDYYQELLRTYVIMGSGSLGREIAELAKTIALADLSPREALQLHVERVETLIRGLGSRSCRHVMARADLLALELMVHLGECFQRRLIDERGAR